MARMPWAPAVALVLVACGDISPAAETNAAATASDVASAPTEPAGVSPIVTAIRTASDARYHIESRGFSNVASIAQDASGRWTAAAVSNGAPVHVFIDADGAVTVLAPAAR
ncbi:MAG: hypothetical protein JNJ73_01655 [Hyphomonadaceae bacterium]|nr:hypothetical protein [Hyphomonadaceae bacterium]